MDSSEGLLLAEVVMETSFEQLLNSQEAAKLLGVHPKTLMQIARRGKVPAVRVGKFWRFRASALDSWVGSVGGRLVDNPYVSRITGGSGMKVNRVRYQFGSLYLWKGVKRSGTSVTGTLTKRQALPEESQGG